MIDILKLIVAFCLTTVAGGCLGYYFQNRSWRQQNKAKQLESERSTATKAFEEISRLMDKRLYRMRQIFWRLKNPSTADEILEMHLNRYRELLYEWNDNLNRNLALAQAYFGKAVRRDLELNAYEIFRDIGAELETSYNHRKNGKPCDATLQRLEQRIWELGVLVYNVNLKMIRLIQENTVGVFNPDALTLEQKPNKRIESDK